MFMNCNSICQEFVQENSGVAPVNLCPTPNILIFLYFQYVFGNVMAPIKLGLAPTTFALLTAPVYKYIYAHLSKLVKNKIILNLRSTSFMKK